MTAVTIVGMAAGSALLLTAIAIFLMKRDFPAGGVGVTLIALVLIGMSHWTSIKIKGPRGIDIDLMQLRRQIEETASGVRAADVRAARIGPWCPIPRGPLPPH